jgi:hypothetical protein
LSAGDLPYKLMERILRGKRHATRILALIEADRK